jgi:hypothetical protein
MFYSKDKYLKDFYFFVEGVKNEYLKYTEEDWALTDQQYKLYTEDYYVRFREELTDTDQETIGKLKGAYNTLKLKKGASDFIEQVDDILKQTQGMIEGTLETINE